MTDAAKTRLALTKMEFDSRSRVFIIFEYDIHASWSNQQIPWLFLKKEKIEISMQSVCNALSIRWSARNYSNFWGRTLEDGMRYRLGTLFPDKSVQVSAKCFF